MPSGARQLLPSPGIPGTNHPTQPLPSDFQIGCCFVLCLLALIEIPAINVISRTAVRANLANGRVLVIAKKTPAERK